MKITIRHTYTKQCQSANQAQYERERIHHAMTAAAQGQAYRVACIQVEGHDRTYEAVWDEDGDYAEYQDYQRVFSDLMGERSGGFTVGKGIP